MKSYGQYCALARALDVVGDRWTLLIVRELMDGPRRYTQLRAGLPGVATNLLAERLRQLEERGVIAREEESYVLTARGRELDGVLTAVFRWGLPLMASGQGDDTFRDEWLPSALRRIYDGARAEPPVVIAAGADGAAATLTIGDGGAHVTSGRSMSADVSVTGPPDAVLGVLSGMLAADHPGVDVTGDHRALDRALAARSPFTATTGG